MKTKEEYKTGLLEAIELCKNQIIAIEAIKPAMKTLDGKNIRQIKQITNKLNETLPESFSVRFGETYSWYSLRVYKSGTQIIDINCGYIREVETFDYDLITGAKERESGGMLGNNYYFNGYKDIDVRIYLQNYEKSLVSIDADYQEYVELHNKVKSFNSKCHLLQLEIKR